MERDVKDAIVQGEIVEDEIADEIVKKGITELRPY